MKHDSRDSDSFTISINEDSADELFDFFKRKQLLDFKREYMHPYFQESKETWETALKAQSDIFRVRTAKWRTNIVATICSWRQADSYYIQMIASDNPVATLEVMLQEMDRIEYSGVSLGFVEGYIEKFFGARGCARLKQKVGNDNHFCLKTSSHYLIASEEISSVAERVKIIEISNGNIVGDFEELLKKVESPVVHDVEGLLDDDINLDKLNAQYETNGLFRRRFAYLAVDHNSKPIAAAVGHRSSFGISLRLLENRIDLFIDDEREMETVTQAVQALLKACVDQYADFPPGFLPILLDQNTAT